MKKICFVTTVGSTYLAFLKDFSDYLYATGEYDISLICDGSESDNREIPEYVHFYPVTMKRGVNLSAISAINDIKKILKREKFDIVQYSTPNAAFYTSIAARAVGIPVRLYCQWGIRYMGFEGWKRTLFKFLEKRTCDNSTFIEAESHNIRNFSVSEGLYSTERSLVIWNGSASGVNLKKFNVKMRPHWRCEIRREQNISENEVVFAFAGRLTADKGINELLESFLNISQKNTAARLMIMGRMDNSESLNTLLMDKAKKTGKVVFTGNVTDIERYYAATDVFVAPSYREGFGLVVVEAEAMGLPAVVSNVPGQIDAIIPNQTGLACKVKDVATLEAAMEQLLNDADLRDKMGKAAAEFAERDFEQKQLFGYLKKHRDELIKEKY